MPYHRIPDEEKAKAVGLSIDTLTVERFDALLRVGRRDRSPKYRELLIEAVEARYGEHWREIADALRRQRGLVDHNGHAVAEREAVAV